MISSAIFFIEALKSLFSTSILTSILLLLSSAEIPSFNKLLVISIHTLFMLFKASALALSNVLYCSLYRAMGERLLNTSTGSFSNFSDKLVVFTVLI